MAPEQAAGRPADARADLFSAGVVLYRMFTGDSPFRRHDVMATLNALATFDPPRPAAMPEPLWNFVRRLLAKSPAGRPADASAALAEWRSVEDRLGGAAPPRSRRGRAIAAGFAALAIAAGVVVTVKDKDGRVVAQLAVPEGGSVTQSPAPAAEPPKARAASAGRSRRPGASRW
jgi:serine/threonine-protein kinase